jgi:signal transduction histidine kinase
MVSKLENPHGLRWRIAVVIPENDLMGSIQSRYNLSLAMIMIMLILGTIAGIYILNKVTQPLLMVASGYNEITSGNWDVEIKQKRGHIKEVHEMIKGFNLMVDNIKSYIGKLVEKQNEIEELHKTETHRMNLIIDEKTENLKAVMEELMERERLASLGELVSGVAHEINTPLGVAVSASSLMEANNESFKKELLEGSISKSGLVSYIESIDETTAILNSNLYRAAELVKSFKEIAVNQSIEEKSRFNFREYIDSILLSLKHEYKNKNVEFKIDCPDDLVINNYSGAISQVFTNLIMNSLIHGFKDMKSGQINISVAPEDENLIIHYKDRL